jgi:spermidine synthase
MRPLVVAFFFLSGLAGLLYEVVWIRAAGTVIGNTTYAIGTVIGVYMAGLGLGAVWGGRLADRRSGGGLLRLYGLLEAGAGVTAVLAPFLFQLSFPLFKACWSATGGGAFFAVFRVAGVAAVLLPPTTLMGATLPVLARFLVLAPGSAPAEAGKAYAVNTFGGVAGVLLGGFWLIPSWGLGSAAWTAFVLNVGIALASVAMARNAPATATAEPAPEAGAVARPVLWIAGLSGFAALLYEVAWTRALILAMGSTVYSFTLILAAFILGLAAGSAAGASRLPRVADPLRALGRTQLVIGLSALLLLPWLGDLPLLFARIVEAHRKQFGMILAWQSLVSAAFVFLPTFFMGAVFPLACRAAGMKAGTEGRSVAAVYGWNTAGCILGSVLGSFVLMPHLGLADTIRLAATVNLGAAAWTGRRGPRPMPGLVLPLLVLAAGWMLPAWSPKVLAAGSFLYGESLSRSAKSAQVGLRDYVERQTVLEAQEWDAYGLVTVHRNANGTRSMRINGKVDASSGGGDMATQLYLSDLPLLHHPAPKRALVIGLGAGITLAAAARHPLERIDCVEISPAVARAARRFRETNRDVLDDPRVRLTVGDGRNVLRFGGDSYDAIICQPSNLWLSGMANLFTRDFFGEAKSRLTPDGIFCQWIHAYRLSTADFQAIVRTFFNAFEHGSLWEVFPGTDYLLLGSAAPSTSTWSAIDARLREGRGSPELRDPKYPGALALAGHLVATAETVRRAAGTGTEITDDRCSVEYTAPWSLYRDERPGTLAWLDEMRGRGAERELYRFPDEATAKAAADRQAGRREVARAMALYSAGRTTPPKRYDPRGPDALRVIAAAPSRDRETQDYFDSIAAEVLAEAKAAFEAGFPEDAVRFLESIPSSAACAAEAGKVLEALRPRK